MSATNDHVISFGTAVRSLDNNGRVGGYLVPFTGPDAKDLYDTYFTADTYYGARAGDGSDTLYNHGLPVARGLEHLADRILPPVTTRADDVGLWAEVVLNLADEYERKIHDLTQRGILAWSSGSASHMVRIEDDGRVTRWPIIEASLTHAPATPNKRTAIVPLRSLLQSEQEGNTEDMTIELNERLDKIEEALRSLPVIQRDARVIPGDTANDSQASSAAYEEAFRVYALSGDMSAIRAYHRAMGESTEAAGGALVPPQYSDRIITKLTEMSIARSAGANVLQVEGTDSFSIPRMAFSGRAQITREGQPYNEDQPGLELITWHPYKYTRLSKSSEELLEDSRVDIVSAVLMPDAAQSFSAAENEDFIVGTGVAEPRGALTDTPIGVTAASATDITADELIDLHYSLSHLYRPNAVWVVNDTTASYIRKLKSGGGNYLWADSLQVGQPPSFLGKPVYISSSIDTIATGKKPVVFGDFSYYWVVEFNNGRTFMQRMTERYADTGEIGFRWYKRQDGRIVDDSAFVCLQMA